MVATTSLPTTDCPYCGKPLQPRYYELFGVKKQAGCFPCDCDGAKAAQAEARRREQEKRQAEARKQLIVQIQKSGISPRFEHAEHPLADQYAKDAIDGKNIYIYGPVGSSKTHLAAAISITLIKAGKQVIFTSMWKILDEIKSNFHQDFDPILAYKNATFLVLDDLGKEAPTDFVLERIFSLIDERYSQLLPTIITTQYRGEKLIECLAKNGDYDTAVAIVSRLRQDCVMVELKGSDRRLEK